MKRCPACGIDSRDEEDRFCRECGKPLMGPRKSYPSSGDPGSPEGSDDSQARPAGKCPNCGRAIPYDAPKCPYCNQKLVQAQSYAGGAQKPTEHSKQTKKIVSKITSAVLLVGTVFFLLCFHIVRDVPLIAAKDHLTFRDTFVTVEGYLERYNQASLFEGSG